MLLVPRFPILGQAPPGLATVQQFEMQALCGGLSHVPDSQQQQDYLVPLT